MANSVHDLRRSLERESRGGGDGDVAVRPRPAQQGSSHHVPMLLAAGMVVTFFVFASSRRVAESDADPLFQRF